MEFQDEIADEVTTDVCKIEVDDWVVLIYKKEIFIRTVEMIRDKKYVVCMDSCEVNLFKWPNKAIAALFTKMTKSAQNEIGQSIKNIACWAEIFYRVHMCT